MASDYNTSVDTLSEGSDIEIERVETSDFRRVKSYMLSSELIQND